MMEEPRDPPSPEDEGSVRSDEGPPSLSEDGSALVWGGKPPSDQERLMLMQEMVEGRVRLDRLLSNLPADAAGSPGRAVLAATREDQSLRCTDAAVFREAVEVLREGSEAAADTFYEVLSKVFDQGPSPSPAGGSGKWSRELKMPLVAAVPSEQLGELARDLPSLSSVVEGEVADVHLHLEDVAGQSDDREVSWAGGTQEVMRQVRRAVQRLDRILPCREAEERASTALAAVLLCLSHNEAWATQGLSCLLGAEDGTVRLDVIKTARRHLRLRFGVRQWRPQSYGLGVFVESYFRVRLLPGKQPAVEGGEEAERSLATVLCGCSHAFSLGQEEREAYADALSEEDAAAAPLPFACDLRLSQLSLRLRMREADGAGGDNESVNSAEGMDGGDLSPPDDSLVVMDEGPNNFNPLLPLRGGGGTKRPRPVVGMYTRPLVSQVYGWGENQCGCLGFAGEGVRAEPHLLPGISSLPVMERVVKVAVSSRHALLVTSLGSVYTAGDGTDGALGHGDLLSLHRFRIVDFFARQKPPPLITAVSAAADILGSHSAAVDSDGRLYTWGFGQATGHSASKPVQEPKDLTDLLGDGAGGGEGGRRVLAVACGGGYCLALVQGGQAYSWGLWAHGRLGLGPPAVHVDGFSRRRLHKYKLKPALVQGKLEKERVVRIAAGTGHSLAVTETGQVFSWGRDDFGQLGLDARTSSGFTSVFEPEPVAPFGRPTGAGPRAVDVACGAFHSMALDDDGQVWTWGAAGGPCLGHGDAVSVEGRPVDLPTLLRRQQASDRRLPVLASKPVWAVPRRVEALAHVAVKRLAGGSHHSAAVAEDGSLFLWGESLSTLQPVAEDEEEEGTGDEGEKGEEAAEEEEAAKGGVDLEAVHVPCQPTSNWLPQLAGKWVETVACGGHTTVVVASGDRVGMVLGRKLLQGVTRTSSSGSGDDDASVSSVRSFLGTEGTERDGSPPPDVLLLVSGRVLPAHKLLLARRSPTFRDLIAAEERPGDASPLQLVLPDLRVDVCRALLQYIYTDNLFGTIDFRSSLPVELQAAAHAYQLPRLAAMCASFLGQTEPMAGGKPARPPRLPPCMMPADVGGGLGDTAWADVRFIASGRALLAHRFILAAQSEYFCAMFRSGMREGAIRANAPVEIAVPDSYGSMARLLLFIYSGTAAAASNDDVVEDLMAADRYRLLDLKRLCESMVRITPGNCLDVLRLADLYTAPRLREAALSFAVRHLGRVAEQPNYLPFADSHPELMRVIFDKIKATSPHTYSTEEEAGVAAGLLPSPDEEKRKKKEEEDAAAFDPGPFPWVPLALLLVLALVYREASRTIALGPVIPALNIALTLALVVYGITVLSAK